MVKLDEESLKAIYKHYIKEICHYSQKQIFATSSKQKNYFQLQIDEAAYKLYNILKEHMLKWYNETECCTDNNPGGLKK